MKSKKPLSDKELEAFEATRNIGAELLKSVRQMKAGKGCVVLSPVISARKNSACRKPSLPACWGSRFAHCKNGSKGACNRAAQQKH